MSEPSALNELAPALSKAQAEIRAASKDATNPHFKSKYADLAAIWDACREPLTKNGLSVIQLPGFNPENNVASVKTILLHESGQSVESVLCTPVAKADAQGIGSALTYLRRYALAATAGVAPDDDDGNAASTPSQSRTTSSAAATKSQLEFLRKLIGSSVVTDDERSQLWEWIAAGPTKQSASKAIEHWKETIEKRKAKGEDAPAQPEPAPVGADGADDSDLPF